jgi:hypothetical protein
LDHPLAAAVNGRFRFVVYPSVASWPAARKLIWDSELLSSQSFRPDKLANAITYGAARQLASDSPNREETLSFASSIERKAPRWV